MQTVQHAYRVSASYQLSNHAFVSLLQQFA
jgi:hypothetical protein